MRGSHAQSCRLTVCELQNGVAIPQSCTNVSIARDPNQQISAKMIPAFRNGSGTYAITEVVETESDGTVTILRYAADVQTISYWQPTTVHATRSKSEAFSFIPKSKIISELVHKCYNSLDYMKQ